MTSGEISHLTPWKDYLFAPAQEAIDFAIDTQVRSFLIASSEIPPAFQLSLKPWLYYGIFNAPIQGFIQEFA